MVPYNTIEAVIREGKIYPLEPDKLPREGKLLLIILNEEKSQADPERIRNLMNGIAAYEECHRHERLDRCACRKTRRGCILENQRTRESPALWSSIPTLLESRCGLFHTIPRRRFLARHSKIYPFKRRLERVNRIMSIR